MLFDLLFVISKNYKLNATFQEKKICQYIYIVMLLN